MTALSGFVIWRVWQRSDEPVEPYVRTIFDIELQWRCEAGHVFEALGQIELRHCWKCGSLAYPITDYRCPTHGSFEAAVQFAMEPDGTVHPDKLRFRSGPWVSAQDQPPCPRCGQRMVLVPAHSLEDIKPDQVEQDGRYIGPP